jgi:hypothetical protein
MQLRGLALKRVDLDLLPDNVLTGLFEQPRDIVAIPAVCGPEYSQHLKRIEVIPRNSLFLHRLPPPDFGHTLATPQQLI